MDKIPVSGRPGKRFSTRLKQEVGEWMPILLTAALIVLLSKTVWLCAVIPTASMDPTLPSPCYVFSSRVAYWFSAPQRGDVVLFRRDDGDKTIYAKRVIGLPGDVVDIIHGKTYINDEPLEEPYLPEAPDPSVELRLVVPEDCYFMMGDNRNHSRDSRHWEERFVPEENILSKVAVDWTICLGENTAGKEKIA